MVRIFPIGPLERGVAQFVTDSVEALDEGLQERIEDLEAQVLEDAGDFFEGEGPIWGRFADLLNVDEIPPDERDDDDLVRGFMLDVADELARRGHVDCEKVAPVVRSDMEEC